MTLSAELLAQQQANNHSPLCKIIISGSATHEYTHEDRIIRAECTETPYSIKAEIVLDNSDNALKDIGMMGYSVQLGYGQFVDALGSDEWHIRPKMWVKNKHLLSVDGRLLCYVYS